MNLRFSKFDFALAPSSIRFRAALFATIGVMLLFLLFALLEASRVGMDLQQVTGAQQMTLVTRIAEELDDKIRITHRALIETAAAIPPRLMQDPAALERSLQNQPGFRSMFDDVYVIGRDGHVLVELPKLGRRGIDVHDRNYYRNTMETGAPAISEPYMGRGLKEPTVMMTAPILDRSGEVVGMLTGALHPLKPNLLGKLADAHVGKTGSFALFTRDRVIVVSQDRTRIMTPGPAPGVSPSFDHAVAGQAGWEESTNSRGLHALFSYTPLTAVPWVLSAALPIDEAKAPIALAQRRVAGMAALLALLVAPLVWFGAGALLAPIGELRDTIQRIRREPSATTLVQMARRDEIGDLAVDFNRMVEELREHTRTLDAEKDLNRQIIETSPVGIAIYDENGSCISANASMARHTGLTREQLLGQNYHRIDSWKRYGIYDLARRARDGTTPLSEVMRVVTSAGKDVWLDVTFCPLLTNGRPHLMQMTGDLTGLKQAELALVESEEKLRRLYELSPLGIALTDMNGRFVEFNNAFQTICGYPAAELKALDYWTLTPRKYEADEQRQLESLERTGRYGPYEKEYVRKDGHAVPLRLNGVMITGTDGRKYIWSIVEDFTEQKAAELAMAHEHTRLETILRTASDGIHILNGDGLLIEANDAFLKMLGYDRTAINHLRVEDWDALDEWDVIRKRNDALIDTRETIVFETRHKRFDGAIIDVEISARGIEIEGERFLYAASRDITERKKMQSELMDLNATLERRVAARTRELEQALATINRAQDELVRAEKLAALGALVAGVAHELNTPIGNAVTIASTLRDRSAEFGREIQGGALRRSVLDEYTRAIAEGSALVMRNLDHAADLVANFKQVAVDQTSAQRRQFDLKVMIEEVLSTLHHLVHNKPIRVVTRLAEGVQMDSYPGPLGQVINNLFNNALIHGFAGRAGGEIVIETRREGTDRAVLEVRDDGNGIAGENLRKVFDPFFTTRLGQGGSGLGLNIVHNIVTQILGGRINANSASGRGTTFTLDLPLTAPAAASTLNPGKSAVPPRMGGS